MEPTRKELVLRLQGLITHTWSSGRYAEEPANALGADLDLRVEGAELAATISAVEIAPETPIAWSVYTQVDGTSDWTHRHDLSYFGPWSGSGPSHARLDTSCTPPAQTRVDLFVGSTRVATATANGSRATAGSVPFFDVRSRVAGCQADGWTVERELPGQVEFAGPNGSSFTIRSLRLGPGDAITPEQVISRVAAEAGMSDATPPIADNRLGMEGLSTRDGRQVLWVGGQPDLLVVVSWSAGPVERPIAATMWNTLVPVPG